MSRPPRVWGLFIAGLWFLVYAIVTFNVGSPAGIALAVLALIAAILLLFGAD